MSSQPNIVHVLYSGVGGEAGVFFPLARAGQVRSVQHGIFYGIEPMAEENRAQCVASQIPYHAVLKRPGVDYAAQRSIADYLVKVSADVVIVHALSTMLAVLQAQRHLPGLRIIAVEHHANTMKSLKRWAFSILALWRADAIVYLSENYRTQVQRKLSALFTLRRQRTHVIGNSLEIEHYPLAQPPADAPFTIGMQGRMVPGKDFALVLRALTAINAQSPLRLRLVFAGDGPLRPSLESLTDELGLRPQVTFLGMIPQPQLIAQMASWHAYAHATAGEVMSISIMEAKACGLPMVVTDAPGVTHFFQPGENGLVVPSNDVAAFAQALLRLATDPALCAHLRDNVRQEALTRYSSQAAWQAYASLCAPTNATIHQHLAPHLG